MAGFSVSRRGPATGHGFPAVTGVMPVANVLDSRWGGVKADAVLVTDAAITGGANQLSSAQAAFTNASVNKLVIVQGAGALIGATSQGPLVGYISSVAGGVASLVTTKGGGTPANATTTVSGVQAAFGSAGLGAAIQTAARAGYRVHLPVGSYMWDTPVTPTAATTTQSLHISGDSRGRTIVYYNNLQTNLQWSGPGLQGSATALTANAVAGDQFLNVTSVAGLSPGDFIFLSSADVFDTVENTTKCGEVCRIQGISGSQLALLSPVCGPNTYFTASTGQVQKITFCEGITFEHIQMVNPAPEWYATEGFAAGLTPLYAAGFSSGIIQFRGCKNVSIRHCRLDGWAGLGYMIGPASIDFTVDDCHFRNGARGSSGANPPYGYAIGVYGAQWGSVSNCSAERSHALVDNNGSGGIPNPVNMPTHLVEVRDSTLYNGGGGGFVAHNPASHVDFIDCRVVGGPQQPPDTSHQPFFQIVGHYCKVIDPIVTNTTGVGINLAGNHCDCIGAVVRNKRPFPTDCTGISVSVQTATPPGAATAGSNRVRNFDIDGVAKAVDGSQGWGILVQANAVSTEILHGIIRNTQADGIDIADPSRNDVVIDDVFFEGIGLDGSTHYCINTAVVAPSANWRNLRSQNLGAATSLTNKASGVISAYQLITSNGTVPALSSHPRIRAVGGGGGGAGGCSGAATAAYVGGGGGAGGTIVDVVGPVASSTLTIVVGAAGTHGAGGAAGGNPGVAGGAGGNTTATDTGPNNILAKGRGGAGGAASAASGVSNVGGGIYGSAASGGTGGAFVGAGSGATSSGSSNYPMICVVGGAGGGAATATNGGGGGTAQLSGTVLDQQTAGSSGGSGTAAGVVGVTATQLGCGGGGGGGGATAAGVGGNGGDGAAGFVEIWW